MNFMEEVNKYAEAHTAEESTLLHKITRETHLEVYQAVMLSGQLQGRFLSLLSRLLQPKTIVEIGTFTGYSALCLAEGLPKNGILHTIEINDELAERSQTYFNESEYKNQIQLHIGHALDLLPTFSPPIDLVFIDADKPNYSNYFDLLIDKISKGGLIIADNVLFHGEVLASTEKRSKNGKAMKRFNQKVTKDQRVRPLFLPLRDGLFILEKISNE